MLERGLALCRASGNRDWLRGTAGGLGSAYAAGRLAEGRALLEEAISEGIRRRAAKSCLRAAQRGSAFGGTR